MDLTLDFNKELFPLRNGESFSLVLASSLIQGEAAANGMDGAEEEKDVNPWRPDGKGRKGLEEDYEYVMHGRVSNFIKLLRACLSVCFIRYISMTEEPPRLCMYAHTRLCAKFLTFR
jgi:hypothetical protein